MIDYSKENFWEHYPELIIAPGLDKFYTKDKTKNKRESSLIMWCIDLCENLDSKFYNLPDKYTLVAEATLKDEKFKWEPYSDIIEFYRECCLTDAERSLTLWNDTMKMRGKTIKILYQELLTVDVKDLDTKAIKDVDAMLASTPKMFDDYKKIKADYEEEKVHRSGKSVSSMSDADEI